MKTKKMIQGMLICLAFVVCSPLKADAQTTQTVTIYTTTNSVGVNYPVQTNQIISRVGSAGSGGNDVLYFYNGYSTGTYSGPQTGVTNISVKPGYNGVSYNPGLITFQITTPAPQATVV